MNSLLGNREYLFDQVPALMNILEGVHSLDEMGEYLPKMSLVHQGLLGKPMAPMLILAGVLDTQVPIEDEYLLLSKGDVPKEAWINPHGGHLGRQVGVWPDPRIFKEVIIPWLVKTLQPPAKLGAPVAHRPSRQASRAALKTTGSNLPDENMSDEIMSTPTPEPAPAPPRKRFYTSLWVQVSVAIVIAVIFGYLSPARAVAMKPLGDAFIRMITMIITVMIFCTVVTGIAGMQDLKKVGRVGGKALLYFEIISTLALAVGFLVGNLVHPGRGFNVDASKLDARAVADYAGQAKAQTVTEFLMHIIPTTMVDAFAKGDILEVVFVSILFGFGMSAAGVHARPLITVLDSLTKVVFRMVNIVMRFAPIGAFGAMAFTIGKYGLASLGPLAKLIATFYVTSILFVFIVFGGVAWLAGFSLVKFLLSHQRRNSAGAGHQFVRNRHSHADGKARSPGLLALAGRPGRAHGLHLQHRRQQPLHDDGRLIRRAGHQHASDLAAADDDLFGRCPHLEGRERRAGSVVHRAGRNLERDPDDSGGRHGAHPRHRPLHEHVPRAGQHDRQRRGHAGGGALGE